MNHKTAATGGGGGLAMPPLGWACCVASPNFFFLSYRSAVALCFIQGRARRQWAPAASGEAIIEGGQQKGGEMSDES